MKRTLTTLTPISPYDFDLTAASATHFRGNYGTQSFQKGIFRRLLDVGGRPCLTSIRSQGTVDRPRLEVELKGTYPDDEIVAEVLGQVKHILGTEQDLAPFYRMALEDPELNPLAQELWGLHIPQTESIWEALVLAILGQQVSSHVAHIIRTLLVQTYGTPLKNSGITYHTFPSPEALMAAGVEGLRSIKLSRRKAQYIADIATSVTSGEKDLEGLRDLPDEEVTSLLTAIRGVGPWTAQWLLILGMGRTDGFPHGDLALRRALGLLLKDNSMPEPEEALRYSRRWSPFRSYATTYIFAALRSGRLAEAFARGNKEEGRRRKIS